MVSCTNLGYLGSKMGFYFPKEKYIVASTT